MVEIVMLPNGTIVARPAGLDPRTSAYLEALAFSAKADADRAEAQAQSIGAGPMAAATVAANNAASQATAAVAAANAAAVAATNASAATNALAESKVSRAGDTVVGTLDFSPNGGRIRFGHPNQGDANDGSISVGLFGEGLNITGTKTTVGGGLEKRLINFFGDAIFGNNVSLNQAPTLPVHAANRGYVDSKIVPQLTASQIEAAIVSLGWVKSAGSVPVPSNNSLPSLSGSTALGSTLTFNQGAWTGAVSITNQLSRNGINIPGATGPTYVIVSADQGQGLRLQDTASNTGGSASAVSAVLNIPTAGSPSSYAITASPANFTIGSPDGTTVSNLSPVGSGYTRAPLSPADNRFILSAGADRVVKGLTAVTAAGASSYTVTDTPTAGGAPVSLTFTITVAAAPVAGAAVTTFRSTDFVRPTIPTVAVAGVTFAPLMLEPAGVNDLVGRAFTAPATIAMPARYFTFQQGFAPGMAMPADNMDILLEGITPAVPMQKNVQSLYADGSIKLAHFTLLLPAIAAAGRLRGMIRKGAAAIVGGSVVLAAGAAGQFTGSITVVSRIPYHADANGQSDGLGVPIAVGITTDISPAALLAAAGGDNGTLDYWMRGPLATSARFRVQLTDAIRVELDVTQYLDGAVEADWHFAADGQLGWTDASNPSSWGVTVSLAQGGTNIYTLTNARIWQSKAFDRRAYSGLTAAQNAVAVPTEHGHQIDLARSSHWGFTPPERAMRGIANTRLANFETIADAAGFRNFESANGLNLENMGGTGGRSDIGYITGAQQGYFHSQTQKMWQVVAGEGEAAGRCTLNNWDIGRAQMLNIFATIGRPGTWVDYRDTAFYASGFKAPDGFGLGGFDAAHQPAFAHMAYMLSGRRRFRDYMVAQANYVAHAVPQYSRNKTAGTATGQDWVIIATNQVREWALRDVGEAVWLLPDADVFATPLRNLLTYNAAWLNGARVDWARKQGGIAGWLPDVSGGNPNDLKPWMQDNFFITLFPLWKAGIVGVYEYFAAFASNFISGRGDFPGADPDLFKRGSLYSLKPQWTGAGLMSPASFAGLYSDATIGAGAVTNLNANGGWDTGGNFTQLWARSLAVEAMILKSPRSLVVFDKIIPAGPYTTDSAYRTDGSFTESITAMTLSGTAAVLAAPGAFGAATASAITPNSMTIAVADPATGGALSLRSYRIKAGAGAFGSLIAFQAGGFVLTGLTGGVSYTIEFIGNNGAGNSVATSLVQATPIAAVPVITAGQTFTVASGAVVGTVIGTVMATGGAATSWAITAGNTGTQLAISNSGVITAIATTTTATLTLTVTANNSGGTGTGSVGVTISGVATPSLILNSMPNTTAVEFWSTLKASTPATLSVQAFRPGAGGGANSLLASGTTADIAFTNGELDKGALGTFANGVQVFVETWYGQFANKNLGYTTTNGRPALTDAAGVPLSMVGGTNNRSTLRFGGQGIGLGIDSFATLGAVDYGFIIGLANGPTIGNDALIITLSNSPGQSWYDDGSGLGLTTQSSGALRAWQGFNGVELAGVMTPNTAGVASVLHSAAGGRQAGWNGALSALSGPPNAIGTPKTLKIAWNTPGNSGSSWNGDMSALFAHAATDATDRAAMIAWMRTNLGI